jgi:hypothetical protein
VKRGRGVLRLNQHVRASCHRDNNTPLKFQVWIIDADQHVITRHMSRRVFELSWAVWVRLRKSRDGAATSTPPDDTTKRNLKLVSRLS